MQMKSKFISSASLVFDVATELAVGHKIVVFTEPQCFSPPSLPACLPAVLSTYASSLAIRGLFPSLNPGSFPESFYLDIY